MRTRLVSGFAGLALLVGVAIAFADLQSAHGPYPGATGAPSIGGVPAEFDCTLCHDGGEVNLPGGRLEILGVPAVYTPGQVYPLTVRLNSSATTGDDGRKWGFELGAVRRDDGAAGGTIVLADPDTLQIVSGDPPFAARNYVEQTFNGTRTGLGGPVQWTFSWQAPAGPEGQIDFFAAGNAANGSGGSDGDHIYTTRDSAIALGTADAPVEGGAALALAPVLPNPARGPVTLGYTLQQAGRIDITIVDARGRLVRRVLLDRREAGAGSVRWDGRSSDGSAAASGVYFARLRLVGETMSPVVRQFVLSR
jgi:hypothetical protein